MEIFDGERLFEATLAEVAQAGHLAKRARRGGVKLPPLPALVRQRSAFSPPAALVESESDPTAVRARVYRNQWIVDCPDCGNAEMAFIRQPSFMCSHCFNGVAAGAWRSVLFPPNRDEIEAVLKVRPIPATRNWSPGETVEDLRRENREHGLAEVAR